VSATVPRTVVMFRDLDPVQLALAEEVGNVLAREREETDPRRLFMKLGRERLIAVHYPVRYGGRGMKLAHHSAVAEEIGRQGLPDVVHLVTVQGVGCTILTYGNERQCARWLPEIASGRILASLMLSEHGAGSDLARIETTATPDDFGWRINGTKAWMLHADWSRLAICSAKTSTSGSRYKNISLFLVELDAPGITITPVSRLAGEPYFLVELDDLHVDTHALLGPLDGGWSLLPAAIGFERGGFDYLTRGWRWLRAAQEELRRLPVTAQAELAADLVRLQCGLEDARALAFHAAYTASGLEVDEVIAAYTKVACGRAAQAVARWAGEALRPRLRSLPDSGAGTILRSAIAEAPEFTISGGSLDLQLDLIAHDFPIGGTLR
jgi:3-oxo-4-pregnene-20-carboxyl-CoA dehydrogenase beta subunit